jgi:glycosyltransferase involved in cell wall biosynthesis
MNKKVLKTISIVLPCYNEEENIPLLYSEVIKVCDPITGYQFEFVFIDNHSSDQTVSLIKELIQKDQRVKLIINARNFGHIRSPFYGMMQTHGDAVILMASDLQDPPEMIPEFIKKWEEGFKVVAAIKPVSQESKVMFKIRKLYYSLVARISEAKLIHNFTGFGLYDKHVIDTLKTLEDPYPYFRGLISELGFKVAEVPFNQPRRLRGITKNNFYTLYDIAMLGITSHSKVPLRLATIFGFFLSGVSMTVALIYLILKLIFWKEFALGIAPVLIGVFFFFSIQLFFTGLLGEYIMAIHTQVLKRPLVVEEERLNFNIDPPKRNME